MANLARRDFWSFPLVRIPSIIDDIEDELMPMGQAPTGGDLSVSEDEKNVYIEAAIPGIDPEDVEVTYDRGMVWIRGEAREEEEDKKRKFYRRADTSFSYRIAVPGEIDQNAEPKAEYNNGMIMITFQKAASSMPKKITVKKGIGTGEAKVRREKARSKQ